MTPSSSNTLTIDMSRATTPSDARHRAMKHFQGPNRHKKYQKTDVELFARFPPMMVEHIHEILSFGIRPLQIRKVREAAIRAGYNEIVELVTSRSLREYLDLVTWMNTLRFRYHQLKESGKILF